MKYDDLVNTTLKVIGSVVTLAFIVTLFVALSVNNHREKQHNRAKQCGKTAYHLGAPITANPHKNEVGQTWLEGYIEAQNGTK